LFILVISLSACVEERNPPIDEELVVINTAADAGESDDASRSTPIDATPVADLALPDDGGRDTGRTEDLGTDTDNPVDADSTDDVSPGPFEELPTNGMTVEGWQWMNPLPQGNDLRAVWGTSSSDVFTVGDYGTILQWDGQSWEAQPSGTTVPLNDVWGTDSERWAVGDEGTILQWEGNGWSAVVSGTDQHLDGVWGVDENDVWAVGKSNTVLHWDGNTWTPRPIPSFGGSLNDVHGTGADDVWAVGGPGYLVHWDGSSWTKDRFDLGLTDQLQSVWAVASDTVWTSSERHSPYPGILKWDGTSWAEWNPSGSPPRPDTADATTGHVLWGTGPNDLWIATQHFAFADIAQWDGTKWIGHYPRIPHELLDMWGSGTDDIWVVGGSGVAAHWEGTDWEHAFGGISEDLTGVASAADQVWAVGRYGMVLHWTGGKLLNERTQNKTLWDVWAYSADDVWAVGNEGILLHWDGSHWTTASPPAGVNVGVTTRLVTVWGSAPDDVWTAGRDGELWHYDGTVWSDVDIGTTDRLFGLAGSGPDDIYMLATDDAFPFQSTLWHYDGSDWSPVSTPSTELRAIWGSSADDVWATAPEHILHFDGTSWSTFDSGPSTPSIHHLWGRGPDDVWAAGSFGTVWHWDGATWSFVASPTTGAQSSVHLTGIAGTADEEWIVGPDGELLRRP
jgi:hypothetical protein